MTGVLSGTAADNRGIPFGPPLLALGAQAEDNRSGRLPWRRPVSAACTQRRQTVATLTGQKILITGPTGRGAGPVPRALAVDNEVWGLARFKDPATRTAVESDGVH